MGKFSVFGAAAVLSRPAQHALGLSGYGAIVCYSYAFLYCVAYGAGGLAANGLFPGAGHGLRIFTFCIDGRAGHFSADATGKPDGVGGHFVGASVGRAG